MKSPLLFAAIAVPAIVAALTLAQPTTAPSSGPTSQPADDAGAIRPSDEELRRIEQAAIFAESANVCGLEWEPYYLAFMALERRKDWTDLQIKFIGTYFGAMQGMHNKELQERSFEEDEIAALRDKLVSETKRLKEEAATRPVRKREE